MKSIETGPGILWVGSLCDDAFGERGVVAIEREHGVFRPFFGERSGRIVTRISDLKSESLETKKRCPAESTDTASSFLEARRVVATAPPVVP